MVETVKCLGDRIIVEPIENSDINPDGVVYTGQPKSDFTDKFGRHRQICHGRVAFIGMGRRHPKTGRRIPVEVQPGQYVAFSDSCHLPVTVNGKEHRVIKEGDVMAISDEPFDHISLLYDDEPDNVINVNRSAHA